MEKVPMHLSHKPIVSVDYSDLDAHAGDARFLSLGRSTWDGNEISAKIFREWWDENGLPHWSRQSEELPLWRVLDLAQLLVSAITGKECCFKQEVADEDEIKFLNAFLKENMELYLPRMQALKSLLNSTDTKLMKSETPNIFSFATSELSQDAMFAWLIQWADDAYMVKDSQLCRLGKSFLSLLSDIPVGNIHQVVVGRQWSNIDIWVEINADSVLIIEDKTGTSIHDDQLNRYKAIVEEEYSGKREYLHFAYVKTENEPFSILSDIKAEGYKTIGRRDLLKVFREYQGSNDLFLDYRNHLEEMEKWNDAFWISKVGDWDACAWKGFFQELEKYIEVTSWSYVPNASGGFFGLWWHFIENDEVSMYLQFEESKLCVKIEYEGHGDRSEIRSKYYDILMEEAANRGIAIGKPARFGVGTFMTIGVLPESEIFGSDKLDISTLVSKLKVLEELVDKCMAASEVN